MIGSNYNIQYPPGSSSALHGCLPHHQSPHYVLPLPFLLLFRSCSPSLELPVFVLLYVRFVSMFLLFSAMVPFCFDEGGTSSLSSSWTLSSSPVAAAPVVVAVVVVVELFSGSHGFCAGLSGSRRIGIFSHRNDRLNAMVSETMFAHNDYIILVPAFTTHHYGLADCSFCKRLAFNILLALRALDKASSHDPQYTSYKCGKHLVFDFPVRPGSSQVCWCHHRNQRSDFHK